MDYCSRFVRANLDGVLNVAKKSVLKQYLDDMVLQSLHQTGRKYRDGPHHPLITDIVIAGNDGRPTFDRNWFSSMEEWAEACQELSRSPAVQRLMVVAAAREHEEGLRRIASRGRRRRESSAGNENDAQVGRVRFSSSGFEGDERQPSSVKEGSIDRIINRTAKMDLSTSELAEEQSRWLGKEIRGVRKKLSQIAKLSESEANALILTADEQAKVDRKPVLEAELHVYQTALEEVERKIRELVMAGKEPSPMDRSGLASDCIKQTEYQQEQDELVKVKLCEEDLELSNTTRFTCVLCGVKCPDSTSFELHNSGRKHRNRLAQVAEAEKREVAQAIMAQKHIDDVKLESAPAPPCAKPIKTNAWGISQSATPQPKFKLPPPPHPVVSQVATLPHSGFVVKTASRPIMALKTSPPPAPPVTHFQSILREQQAAKSKSNKQQASPRLPLNGSSPSVAMSVSSTASEHRNTYSLADFLTPPKQPPATPKKAPPVAVAACWASPASTTTTVTTPTHDRHLPPSRTPPTTLKKKSLAEIQAEETEFKAREDRACARDGGRGGGSGSGGFEQAWFLGRRERANSLAAIQEAAEQERELQRMIQEQLEIEAQIQRELLLAAQRTTKEPTKKPNPQATKTTKKKKKGGATPTKQDGVALNVATDLCTMPPVPSISKLPDMVQTLAVPGTKTNPKEGQPRRSRRRGGGEGVRHDGPVVPPQEADNGGLAVPKVVPVLPS